LKTWFLIIIIFYLNKINKNNISLIFTIMIYMLIKNL
jgi:hypothetical protein